MPTPPVTGTMQHYVPQFLLRNFLADGQIALHVFDKTLGKSLKPRSPKSIAKEAGYDDFTREGTPLSIDSFLTDLENKTAPIITKIIERKSVRWLNVHERRTLSNFVAAQHFRVKFPRHQIESFVTGARAAIIERSFDPCTVLPEVSSNDVKVVAIARMAKELVRFSKRLNTMALALQQAPNDAPFFISDNPVTFHDPQQPTAHCNLADDPKIEIGLPISREFSLWFVSPVFKQMLESAVRMVDDRRRKGIFPPIDLSEERRLIGVITSGDLDLLEREHILHLNSLQTIFSARYVYSGDGNFEVVKKMIDQNPSLKKLPGYIFGDDAFLAAQAAGAFTLPRQSPPS